MDGQKELKIKCLFFKLSFQQTLVTHAESRKIQ